jgi:tRNA G18 (ribose-2'-O)-methylase SpoU
MEKQKEFFVLAHNIRSLHNVGSIFRTSDVFGVTKLFLTGYTGHPPDPKIAKVALGADTTIPWEHNSSAKRILTKLRKQYSNLAVVGLENNLPKDDVRPVRLLGSKSFTPSFPLVLVLGEEVSGISRPLLPLCDYFAEIPQYGTKESLNVSVAFGVAAFALTLGRATA